MEKKAPTKEEFLNQQQEAARREALLINLSGRRIGKLYIPIDGMERDPERYQYLLCMMGFLPIRVECRMDIKHYEMIGYCQQFKRLPNNRHNVPNYKIYIEDGETSDKMVIRAVHEEDEESYKKSQGINEDMAMKEEVDITLLDPNGNKKPN